MPRHHRLAPGRLRDARIAAGLTVHEAAARARMPEAAWRDLEVGRSGPPDRLTLKRVFGGHHPLVAEVSRVA